MKTHNLDSFVQENQYKPIQNFLVSNRSQHRLMPTEQLRELSKLLQEHALLEIDLLAPLPLSTMERLVLGLRLITSNYSQRSIILGISRETIRRYEKRAKQKLGADNINQAMCIGIQENTFKVSY